MRQGGAHDLLVGHDFGHTFFRKRDRMARQIKTTAQAYAAPAGRHSTPIKGLSLVVTPMKSNLGIVLVGLLFLAACREWNPTPPPHTKAGEPAVSQAPSTIRVLISANTADISRAVLDEYANKPVSSGRSDEISAKLLVDQKITTQKAEQVLVQPAVSGICEVKSVPRQVKVGVNCVVDALHCATKIFHKCGRVCTDVTKTVFDSVKTCAADQVAVFKTEMTPIVDIQEATLPTSIWINHDVRLQDLQLSVSGNQVEVTALLPITVSIDLKKGVLGADFTVKGALKCDALVEATTRGDIHLAPDATINVALSDFSMNWKKLCVPGAVQAVDVATYMTPLLLASSGPIKKGINRAIVYKLNGALQQASGGSLNLGAAAERVGLELQAPHPIGHGVTLLVHPSRLVASDFAGVGSGAANQIQMTVGVDALPEVVVGPLPPQPAPVAIPFGLSAVGSGFFIDARGSVTLSSAEAKLKVAIDDLLSKKYSDKDIQVGGVELYQSGSDLAVAIEVQRKTGPFKDLGTVYLLARPELSADGTEVDLSHVRFDADSRNALIKLAAWLLDGRVEQYIEEKGKFTIAGKLNAVTSQLSSFSVPTSAGVLSGKVTAVKPEGIWVADGSLWVAAMASGEATFALNPHSVIH